MNKQLYVGKLPRTLTEETLRKMFSVYGPVLSAILIRVKDSDQSRGFGFVNMKNAEDADAALTKMNGALIEGAAIAVTEARPLAEKKKPVVFKKRAWPKHSAEPVKEAPKKMDRPPSISSGDHPKFGKRKSFTAPGATKKV